MINYFYEEQVLVGIPKPICMNKQKYWSICETDQEKS